jgi:dTDP-4-dehydrorhamnose 3,5-epimerase
MGEDIGLGLVAGSMAYTRIETELPGVYILEPQVFGDHRGWFMESWSVKNMEDCGIDCYFVQDNQSFTAKKGTLRGIHYQKNPMAQAKLVRVVRGSVADIAVDLRKGSPTYGQWTAVELSAENKRQFYIPRGFGHAFLTLTDDVEFCYKCDNLYSRECDRNILWNDPDINIDWKALGLETEVPVLSDKDAKAPFLKDSDCDFVY